MTLTAEEIKEISKKNVAAFVASLEHQGLPNAEVIDRLRAWQQETELEKQIAEREVARIERELAE